MLFTMLCSEAFIVSIRSTISDPGILRSVIIAKQLSIICWMKIEYSQFSNTLSYSYWNSFSLLMSLLKRSVTASDRTAEADR